MPDSKEEFQFVGILLALLLVITFSGVLGYEVIRGTEEPGTTIEDFTLYSYGKNEDGNVTWRLTGKRAEQRNGELIVQSFQLLFGNSQGNEIKNEEAPSRLAGETLTLRKNDGKRVASMPGKIKIKTGERTDGTARTVRYNFGDNLVIGREIKLKRTSEDGTLNIEGNEFSYRPKNRELKITNGFEIVSRGPEQQETAISGQELEWTSGERIRMQGEVSATLGSDWKLEAAKMIWDPDQGLLETSGSARASRGETEIRGSEINYDEESEEISVVEGEMVREDE